MQIYALKNVDILPYIIDQFVCIVFAFNVDTILPFLTTAYLYVDIFNPENGQK